MNGAIYQGLFHIVYRLHRMKNENRFMLSVGFGIASAYGFGYANKFHVALSLGDVIIPLRCTVFVCQREAEIS